MKLFKVYFENTYSDDYVLMGTKYLKNVVVLVLLFYAWMQSASVTYSNLYAHS